MKKYLYLSLLLALTFSNVPAHAQTAADIANQESSRIQREQQMRQTNDIQEQIETKKPPTRIEIEAPNKVKEVDDGGVCRDIRSIVLDGATLLSKSDKKKLVKPYLTKCMTINDIQRLLGDITAFYIKAGYPTARAYIPAQDLTKGVLTLTIVEGTVQQLRLNDGGKKSVNIVGAFPRVKGQIFSIRDIEQGLDQINALSSNHATMDIIPGDLPGKSIININNMPEKRWHAGFNLDDYGTSTTGRRQAGLTFGFDNLLGLNDIFSVSRKQTSPLEDNRKKSSSESILYQVPYGYNTFSVGNFSSRYKTIILTPGGSLLALEGTSNNFFVKADRMVYRNKDTRLNTSATLTTKDTQSFLAGNMLAVSSRMLTVLDLDTNLTTNFLTGVGSLGLGLSQGLDGLGALQDAPNLPSNAPRAQFTKFRLSANYVKPFKVFEQPAIFTSAVTGQYASTPLYGSEQIQIGGIYSVRGFYNTTIANDHGYIVRNDLAFPHPVGKIWGYDSVVKPYVALDGGKVMSRAIGNIDGSMVGTAVGASLISGPVFIDLFTSTALKTPSGYNSEGLVTFARLSISY